MNLRGQWLSLLLIVSGPGLAGAAPLIILGPDDNLAATVASAPHGSVIELRSNGFFDGTLSWRSKHLTIQAGAGYTPTIRGWFVEIVGDSSTGCTLRDVTVAGGVQQDFFRSGASSYEFENSTIQGIVSIYRARYDHTTLSAKNSDFLGGFEIRGSSGEGGTLVADVSGGLIAGQTNIHPNAGRFDFTFSDNLFYARPSIYDSGKAELEFDFFGNQLRNGIDIRLASGATTVVNVHDNLIGAVSPPPATWEPGILVRSQNNYSSAENADLSFANNTVVGFRTGLEVRGFESPDGSDKRVGLDFTNMLFYNDTDLVNVDASDISYSLIADGTLAGENHNFTGIPRLGADGRLLAGSIGIDRGDNERAWELDFSGYQRIQDGDGDGIRVVDVGAFEFSIPEPSAIFLLAIVGLFSQRHQMQVLKAQVVGAGVGEVKRGRSEAASGTPNSQHSLSNSLGWAATEQQPE